LKPKSQKSVKKNKFFGKILFFAVRLLIHYD